MTDENTPALGSRGFEDLKQTNAHGAEFWSARDLQPLLGYTQWRRFADAISRAMESCQASGNSPDYHFASAGKMVDLGCGSVRKVDDWLQGPLWRAGQCGYQSQKGIPEKDALMDRMNATELAANQFHMTQTRDKLAREGVKNEAQAIRTHESVGQEVRDAIRRIGGTLPEHIPPDEHIKQVEKLVKVATPKLALDNKVVAGGFAAKIKQTEH